MGYDLKVPEFKPLDFSGFGEIGPLLAAARKTKHDQQNADRKLSADIERSQYEMNRQTAADQDEEARRNADKLPELFRAARRPGGVPIANAMGSAYGGVQFDEDTTKQYPTAQPGEGEGLDEAKAVLNGKGAPAPNPGDFPLPSRVPSTDLRYGPPLQGPTPTGEPLETGPQLIASSATDPLQGPTPSGRPLSEPAEASAEMPMMEAPPRQPLDVDAEANRREDALPTTRHLYAKLAGNRFEIPKTSSSVFTDPEDSAQYERFLDEGDKPEMAQQKVIGMRRTLITEGGRNTRAQAVQEGQDRRQGASLDWRSRYTLDVQQQRAEALARRQQSDLNNRRTAGAHIQGAEIMAGGGGGGELPGTKEQGAILAYSKNAFARAGAKIDQQGMRLHDRIAAELESGNVNPYNQKMAIHTLTAMSMSTAGSGGRVLKSAIDDITNAPAMIDSTENKIYQQFNHGANMPEINERLRNAAEVLRQVGDVQARRDLESYKKAMAPYLRDPRFAELARSEIASTTVSLGLPEDAEASDGSQGGAPMGAPAPAAAPAQRHGGHATPHDDAAAVQWAHAHSADPRAKKILQHNGM